MYELNIKFKTIDQMNTWLRTKQIDEPPTTIEPASNIVRDKMVESMDREPTTEEVVYKDPPASAVMSMTPAEKDPIDKDGTPWDERIHAKTKTKTADGVWKRRRGIESAIFDSIMEELNSGTINHSQLLSQIINGVAEGTLSIFTVQDTLNELGLGSLNDASGNPALIEDLATRLGFL